MASSVYDDAEQDLQRRIRANAAKKQTPDTKKLNATLEQKLVQLRQNYERNQHIINESRRERLDPYAERQQQQQQVKDEDSGDTYDQPLPELQQQRQQQQQQQRPDESQQRQPTTVVKQEQAGPSAQPVSLTDAYYEADNALSAGLERTYITPRQQPQQRQPTRGLFGGSDASAAGPSSVSASLLGSAAYEDLFLEPSPRQQQLEFTHTVFGKLPAAAPAVTAPARASSSATSVHSSHAPSVSFITLEMEKERLDYLMQAMGDKTLEQVQAHRETMDSQLEEQADREFEEEEEAIEAEVQASLRAASIAAEAAAAEKRAVAAARKIVLAKERKQRDALQLANGQTVAQHTRRGANASNTGGSEKPARKQNTKMPAVSGNGKEDENAALVACLARLQSYQGVGEMNAAQEADLVFMCSKIADVIKLANDTSFPGAEAFRADFDRIINLLEKRKLQPYAPDWDTPLEHRKTKPTYAQVIKGVPPPAASSRTLPIFW